MLRRIICRFARVLVIMELKLLAKHILDELEELQASEVTEIDVYGKTSVADLIIICSGRSGRHVKAIASKLVEKLKHMGEPPISSSGIDSGEWALIDSGDVVVHVMTSEVRAFYNLEGLWRNAEQPNESSN